MSESGQPKTLRHYVSFAGRHRWLIVVTAFATCAAAVAISLTQQVLYQSTAEVLISRQNLASTITGTVDPLSNAQPDRVAQTQAAVAKSVLLAGRVVRSAELQAVRPTDLLKRVSVSANPTADILDITVTDRSQAAAEHIATVYGAEFVAFRRLLDTRAFERARVGLEAQLADLRRAGQASSRTYSDLVSKDDQLITLEALQTGNSSLINPAHSATQVQPLIPRNAALGLFLGLLLGLLAAGAREALDSRARSESEVEALLEWRLFGRLPKITRRAGSVGSSALVTRLHPASEDAEPYRMLSTRIAMATLVNQSTVMLVTSAVSGEGKSTTVANLGVAMAQSGRDVILLDLDLRRPSLGRLFGLESRVGLSEVIMGRITVDEVCQSVDIGEGSSSTKGAWAYEGSLRVVPADPVAGPGPELLGSEGLMSAIEALRKKCDIVLIDSAPMLGLSDTLLLGRLVDSALIVVREDAADIRALAEMKKLVEHTQLPVVGFAFTRAKHSDGGYGYGYGYGAGRSPAVSGRDSPAQV